jgi:hypothetical protein
MAGRNPVLLAWLRRPFNCSRRGTPALQLLVSRRCRTADHRCPATREIQGPRTTGLLAAPNAKALVPLSLSTVASRTSPPSNERNWIRGNPHPPKAPSLVWKCETARACQCSAVSFVCWAHSSCRAHSISRSRRFHCLASSHDRERG